LITNEPTTDAARTPVTLTDSAAAKVKELLATEGDDSLALRLAVRPGGCSGFSYDMFFDSEVDESDLVSEHGGVRVLVDTQSAPFVSGAVIDYRDMGLQGGGFAINNPSQTRTCGCGQSFC
jgi:iron-sulfur cluster assembly protein/iron-sulfur cluster insertion protein